MYIIGARITGSGGNTQIIFSIYSDDGRIESPEKPQVEGILFRHLKRTIGFHGSLTIYSVPIKTEGQVYLDLIRELTSQGLAKCDLPNFEEQLLLAIQAADPDNDHPHYGQTQFGPR